MKKWGTIIHALDPLDGEYKEFAGPNIEAPSKELAFQYCQQNGLGYCHIIDEIIAEIPCDDNFKPNWDNAIDFTLQDKN